MRHRADNLFYRRTAEDAETTVIDGTVCGFEAPESKFVNELEP